MLLLYLVKNTIKLYAVFSMQAEIMD